MLTANQLQEAFDALVTKPKFQQAYRHLQVSSAGARRTAIRPFVSKFDGTRLRGDFAFSGQETTDCIERLRRMFDAAYDMPACVGKDEYSKVKDLTSPTQGETPMTLSVEELRAIAIAGVMYRKGEDGFAPAAEQSIYTHPNAPGVMYRKGEDGFVQIRRDAASDWDDCARQPNSDLDRVGSNYVWALLPASPPSTSLTAPPPPVPSPEYEAAWIAAGRPATFSPTPKETTMTEPIEITTKTFANGTDLATIPDSQVYDLIAAEEIKIKDLSAIENKPKKLVAEIEKRTAGIKALVAHLDSPA